MMTNKKSAWAGLTLISVAALLLAGCATTPGATAPNSPKAPAASSQSTPHPDPSASTKNDAKPGFVDTVKGAPKVERPGQKTAADRLAASRATFVSAATYSDGITLTTDKFSRGTVHSQGTGIITGAPFVVFNLSLHNGSKQAVDVSEVVVTLKYGPDAVAAAPLYDDVPAKDFSGKIDPGASQTSTYAFLLPKNVTNVDLYVDVNGDLLPAHFEGALPQ